MSRLVKKNVVLLATSLVLVSSVAAAFPFWLDSPTRSNPNDPKSAAYVAPPSLPIAPAGTATITQTKTATYTYTPVQTASFTLTVSPMMTATPTFSVSPVLTATPTPSITFTSTVSSTRTNTAFYTATATPTAGGHNSLVTDFENNAANDRTYWNGGAIFTIKDSAGSTQTPASWGPTAGTAGGPGGSTFAGCMSGVMAKQVTTTPAVNPYCFMMLELTVNGSVAGAGGADVDLTPYCPNNGLQFDYKAGAAGVTYRVKLLSTAVTDYGYWAYDFTATDTAWHTMTVYFPGVAASANFAQPGWAAPKTFDKTKVGAIMFEVSQQTSGPVTYDLCVDNITFAAPAPVIVTATPTPTPAVTHTSLVMDFENNTANDRTYWNGGAVFTVKDANASTQTNNPWLPTSGTVGGPAGSTYAGCMSGVMSMQNPPSTYSYCFMAMELTPNGTATLAAGGADTNVVPYSPNQGLHFAYKAGAAGVLYRVKLTSTLISDYAYYEYEFTSSDTAWHSVDVYFPGVVGASNVFAQPSYPHTTVAFDATKIGGIIFEPIPSGTAAVTYDLCVDNVTFAVPAPGTPPPLGTGTMIMDFEDNLNNNKTLFPFSFDCATGIGSSPTGTTTMVQNPWTASSGTAPGSNANGPASNYCGRFNGSLAPSGGPPYAYAVMELYLVANGWLGGGGKIDITPYAPNQRLVFDYKAGTSGVTYGVQILTQNVPDYTFFEYDWTPSDTNWHTMIVYFPTAAFSPKLARPNGTYPWDPTQAGDVIFRTVSQPTAVNYDLSIDNVRFD